MPGAARALGQAGRLGALSHSNFCLINGPPERYVQDGCGWVLDAAASGGGVLRNLGIHGVDAFLGLAGEQDVAIEHVAFGRPLHGTPVEDYALVVLRAADGPDLQEGMRAFHDSCIDHAVAAHPHKKSCRFVAHQLLIEIDTSFHIIIGCCSETGGIGGRSWTKNVPWAFAGLDSNYRGGTGGNIGFAGAKGANQASHTGANGGAVGKAIDGVSYVTQSGTPASLLGGQVN